MINSDIRSVNFILGNKCNSNCSHCFSNSVHNSKAKLNEFVAIEYARHISSIESIKEVHFNGGEPLLYLDTLNKVVEIVRSKSTKIIKIATGAGEFSSLESTRQIIKKIRHIDEIWISIDLYHLENISINNYINLNTVIKEMENVEVVYSISYKNIKEYAQILNLIKEHNFFYKRIAKQPVFAFGRAINIANITTIMSDEIPDDFRCAEVGVATIWPSGNVSNCSAYATRAGFVKQHSNLLEYFINNKQDEFYKDRCELTLSRIAEKHNLKGDFDVTSPCSTCKSILNKKKGLYG